MKAGYYIFLFLKECYRIFCRTYDLNHTYTIHGLLNFETGYVNLKDRTMKPTEELMNDHAAISIVLSIMKKIASDIKSGNEFKASDVEKIIDFLKEFADKCHHHKEEKVLFPAMEDAGISRDNGPVGVMLYEHTIGREFIAAMTSSLNDFNSGNQQASNNLAEAMAQYVNLLQNHIMKENNILFPMADKVLDEGIQQEISREFEKIEDEISGKGEHEKFHRMIKQMEEIYLV